MESWCSSSRVGVILAGECNCSFAKSRTLARIVPRKIVSHSVKVALNTIR